MPSFDGLLLSFALGVDAAVVAFAIGLAHPSKSHTPGLVLGVWFGAFQGFMALSGFALVNSVQVIRPYAESGAALIFIALGLKLLWDLRTPASETVRVPTQHHQYLLLAVATSVDAFAAGVGLVNFPAPLTTAGLIGIVAFLMTWGGALLSQRSKHLPEAWAESGGALILIFLGVKSLVW